MSRAIIDAATEGADDAGRSYIGQFWVEIIRVIIGSGAGCDGLAGGFYFKRYST
jgi:hypothetical protein